MITSLGQNIVLSQCRSFLLIFTKLLLGLQLAQGHQQHATSHAPARLALTNRSGDLTNYSAVPLSAPAAVALLDPIVKNLTEAPQPALSPAQLVIPSSLEGSDAPLSLLAPAQPPDSEHSSLTQAPSRDLAPGDLQAPAQGTGADAPLGQIAPAQRHAPATDTDIDAPQSTASPDQPEARVPSIPTEAPIHHPAPAPHASPAEVTNAPLSGPVLAQPQSFPPVVLTVPPPAPLGPPFPSYPPPEAVAADPLDELAPPQLLYPPPYVFESLERHTATVIMIHGLGETGERWTGLATRYGQEVPYVQWVFPNAPLVRFVLSCPQGLPLKRNIAALGYQSQPGWYNIATFSDFAFDEDVAGLLDSVRYIQHLIALEVAAGVPSDRILVSGFSQGGALALLLLRGGVRLAGIAALSTYLPLANTFPLVSRYNFETPVLMCHGTADTTVTNEVALQSYDALRSSGANISYVEYEGLTHMTNDAEFQDVLEFWTYVLPPLAP